MDEKSKVDRWVFNLKNNKYTAPIIFGAFVVAVIITFGKNLTDSFFGNKVLEHQVQGLKENIDTIKQSLRPYDFTLVNNKVVPTESNKFYSKNAAGVVFGNVGDVYNQTKTYNQTKAEKSNTEPVKANIPETDNFHNAEIISLNSPVVRDVGQTYDAIYTLKTKTDEEADNVFGTFIVAFRNKGELILGRNYDQGNTKNTTVVTNYRTDFTYSFLKPTSNVDTFYIYLKVSFSNNVGQKQVPFQALYRRTKSNFQKLTQLFNGTKEYKDVLELMFPEIGPG